MNIQYAIKDDVRVPARGEPARQPNDPVRLQGGTGVPLARVAARVMAGETLDELEVPDEIIPPYFSVKEPVFPFNRFPGTDIILGPEMRSTGEVMGIDRDLAGAFAKAKLGAFRVAPAQGQDLHLGQGRRQARRDQHRARPGQAGLPARSRRPARSASSTRSGVPCEHVHKVADGARPNVLDIVKNREIQLIINTPEWPRRAGPTRGSIRGAASVLNLPCITTLSGVRAPCCTPSRPIAVRRSCRARSSPITSTTRGEVTVSS